MQEIIIFKQFLLTGGMLLGNYLGKKRCSNISYALIVSAQFNAEQTLDESEKFQYRIFNSFITKELKRMVAQYENFSIFKNLIT
jgi:hypothetical protein